MKTFRITKIVEVYYDFECEADDLDQAIDIAKNSDDDEWEEDFEFRNCTKRIWAELNEDGEVKDDGVLTEEELQ